MAKSNQSAVQCKKRLPHYLKKNLRYLLHQAQLDIKTFSELVGLPEPTVGRLSRIEDAKPNWLSLEPIANFFHISVDALMKEDLSETRLLKKSLQYVPIFDLNQLPLTETTKANVLRLVPCDDLAHEAMFAVTATNDAMSPLIRKGTTLIIDPTLKVYDSAIVVLLDDQNNPLVRQVVDYGNQLLFRLVSI